MNVDILIVICQEVFEEWVVALSKDVELSHAEELVAVEVSGEVHHNGLG